MTSSAQNEAFGKTRTRLTEEIKMATKKKAAKKKTTKKKATKKKAKK
jgi:hypothetical protein